MLRPGRFDLIVPMAAPDEAGARRPGPGHEAAQRLEPVSEREIEAGRRAAEAALKALGWSSGVGGISTS